MDSEMDLVNHRFVKSIVHHLDKVRPMQVVVVHSGQTGRIAVLGDITRIPCVGDSIIVREVTYQVVSRTFDYDKREIRLHVS
jgi:hypothetical protein